MFKLLFKMTILLVVVNLLVSCCVLLPNICDIIEPPEPKTLEVAVKNLIDRLENGIRKKDNSPIYLSMKNSPFVYLENSNKCNNFTTLVYKNRSSIEEILINGSDNVRLFSIGKYITKPRYVMYTVIEEIPYDFGKNIRLPKKSYKLTVRVIDNKNKGNIVLTDDRTLITKEKISIKKISAIDNQADIENNYKIFFPIKCSNKAISIIIPPEFEENLKNADKAFNNKQFENAIKYYKKTFTILNSNKLLEDKIPSEKKDVIYTSIIESNYRLSHTSSIEEDFITNVYQKWLINRLFHMNKEIHWTFLFNEGSIEFANDADLETKIYLQRLKMIGKYFKKSNLCLNIVGYRLETENKNSLQGNLVKQRIKLIHTHLTKYAPNLTFEEEEKIVTEHDDNSYHEYRKIKIYVRKNCS